MMSILPPWALVGTVEDVMNRLSSGRARAQIAQDVANGIAGWENRIEVLGYENIFIAYVQSEANRDLEGLSIADAAKKRGEPCLEFIMDLLVAEKGDIGRLGANTCEEDVIDVLSSPFTMIGSDGIDAGTKPILVCTARFPGF